MKRGLFTGLFSGILLGFILKIMETLSSIKVYRLLLNIDFIPFIGSVDWPEYAEFMFHLLVSLCIGITFVYMVEYIWKGNQYLLSFLLTVSAVFLYFPLTILAIEETPAPTNIPAFLLWTGGHAVYALCLPFFYNNQKALVR
ncbi:hypothetical protein [Bacillus sp. 165]|uniref:hypothetical protein n=1 Tax=Bacillus sp. 165 TaxID=1529117 RepID=UPI0032AF4F91